MKSKTRPISKNTAKKSKASKSRKLFVDPSEVLPESFQKETFSGSAFVVGHRPSALLSPHDAELFHAFQSNLLSLISHELRTPLSGIINSLSLLEEGSEVGLSREELILMARSNAQRLNRTLVTLLDLASIESGSFHAHMREIDFVRLVGGRVESHSRLFKDRELQISLQENHGAPLLGDPQKLTRALDLCIEVISARVNPKSEMKIKVSPSEAIFTFELSPEAENLWHEAWSQAIAGYEGGVASPASAFGGVLQSEQAFLTRMEEGLGSEFLLILEIMRLHHGKFEVASSGRKVEAKLSIPELSSEEGLRLVLNSRAYEVSTELGSVALVLINVPKKENVMEFCAKVKNGLFRSSDAVYPLPELHRAALVLDDCKSEDAPRLVDRLQTELGEKLIAGYAHCPTDSHDPDELFDLAANRMKSL